MKKIVDDWFDQWTQTDSYLASDGHVNRIPLRLTSTNLIIYGSANLPEVLKDFEHEDVIRADSWEDIFNIITKTG